MAERRFSANVRIDRTPERVFEWVSDYRNAGTVLEGVTSWTPLGPQTEGTGARFRVSMGALGVSLENQLVIDTWRRPSAIGWRSESGLVSQTGSWSFEARDGGTEVTLSITYRPPAGRLGGALAGAVDGLVRGRLEAALQRMKQTIESG
ncbi:MAG: SRPBCC family protein [Candidatus Dormibacteraeota bacterium]|nr:SRPBCC family protein [Candidatus Dormibacteraeota bacterium]